MLIRVALSLILFKIKGKSVRMKWHSKIYCFDLFAKHSTLHYAKMIPRAEYSKTNASFLK